MVGSGYVPRTIPEEAVHQAVRFVGSTKTGSGSMYSGGKFFISP
jgi:hypothetical protein